MHTEKWFRIEQYVDKRIITDIYDHEEAILTLNGFIHTHPDINIDGAITFRDDNVLLTSKIGDRYGFIGIPYNISSRIRNKYIFREDCEKYGIPAPKRREITTIGNLASLVKDLQFPLVLKPISWVWSINTIKIESLSDLIEKYSYIQIYNPNWESFYIEEYITGDEIDCDILVQDWVIKFMKISDNAIGQEPYFMEAGASTPSVLPDTIQQEVFDMVEQSVHYFGVKYACLHYEFKISPRGPVPIEINLRMGGAWVWFIVDSTWGIDLIEYVLYIALGIELPIIDNIKPIKHSVARYLLHPQSGILTKFDVPEWISNLPSLILLRISKKVWEMLLLPPHGYDNYGLWIIVIACVILVKRQNRRCRRYLMRSS